MQTIFGFILGAALTIGAAYVHDTSIKAPSATASATATERQMVNWDVVETNWRDFKASMPEGWRKLRSIG